MRLTPFDFDAAGHRSPLADLGKPVCADQPVRGRDDKFNFEVAQSVEVHVQRNYIGISLA